MGRKQRERGKETKMEGRETEKKKKLVKLSSSHGKVEELVEEDMS